MINKKNLTVAQILPSLNSGGVEKGTIEIANFLVKKKVKSIVISEGGRLVSDLKQNGSDHILLNVGTKNPLVIFCLPKLIKIILEKKIDIIHARSRLPAWISFIALKFIKKNKRPFFVTTVHGFNSISFYSSIMTKGDKVIAVSNSIKNFILNNYNVDKKKITVIHRGLPKNFKVDISESDYKSWKKLFFSSFPILKNKKILLFPSRISRNKGLEDFIDLIKNLKKEKLNIIGLVVGEAKSENYYDEIKSLIRRMNLTNDIIFLGYRSDIYRIITISKILYAIQRVPESFGRVVVEGIRLGTPVIGYNHGGVGEQLEKIFPNGLVNYADRDKLRKLTLEFISKKQKIKKTNLFSLEEMCKKTLNLYKSFF